MKKYWFVFCNSELMLEKTPDGHFTIPLLDNAPENIAKPVGDIHNITPLNGIEVKAYSTGEMAKDARYELCGLRASYKKLPVDLYMKAGKCAEILYWDANTQYCGKCGGRMVLHTDISKVCTKCGREVWPQLSTAIIVLIHRGDDVLLVHANNFKGHYYGLVAGFVETGETLEQAVIREVSEETGLSICNLRYFGSQPWPYPCGLMVGFHADYDGGEIRLQRSELATAAGSTRTTCQKYQKSSQSHADLLTTGWTTPDGMNYAVGLALRSLLFYSHSFACFPKAVFHALISRLLADERPSFASRNAAFHKTHH